MSLNHAPLHPTLDCRGKWNLQMNYGAGEENIYCIKQRKVWSRTYGPLFIQEI
jgi:hypothetical protein